VVALHWPSEPWGEEQLGGLSFAFDPTSDPRAAWIDAYSRRLGDGAEVRAALDTLYAAAQQDNLPDELPAAVVAAYQTIDRLVLPQAAGVAAAPVADRRAFDPRRVYAIAHDQAQLNFGLFSGDGLLTPLRVLSFWKMKERAMYFGEAGAYPLLLRLLAATDPAKVRFHLMGHSFGCIVVSAAVAGPEGGRLPRPVDSLALVQGALSLWSYCADIPSMPELPGYFHRVVAERRVRGPIITTQSSHDAAVGRWYPLAAGAAGQVAYAIGTGPPEYGAVGAFGLQGPGFEPTPIPMNKDDYSYGFAPGSIYNLESSQYICHGSGFSGAHSDICQREVAHAVWQATMV
jgi:hypothetical protein